MAGLDPLEAWSRTPGENAEYIEAYRDRLALQAWLLYDQANAIAQFCFSKSSVKPWEAFPTFIEKREMTEDEIVANCLAWCT